MWTLGRRINKEMVATSKLDGGGGGGGKGRGTGNAHRRQSKKQDAEGTPLARELVTNSIGKSPSWFWLAHSALACSIKGSYGMWSFLLQFQSNQAVDPQNHEGLGQLGSGERLWIQAL